MPECLISGDLRNSFFKVVRSSSESRLYLSWNALQNISVNCCTLSPGDCIAFWTSRISSSAGVVSGALSLSFSCALRMSWRMVSHDDLQVGDEIILTIRSSEIENLQKEDDNKAKIAVEQLQLGTQKIK